MGADGIQNLLMMVMLKINNTPAICDLTPGNYPISGIELKNYDSTPTP